MKHSHVITLGCLLAGLGTFTSFGCGSTSDGPQVGSGGTTSNGGTIGSGGTTSSGGTSNSGGTTTATGGTTSSGGTTANGGTTTTGGRVGSGGSTSTGGATATGGRVGSGGTTSAGGSAGTADASASGGRAGSGGATGSGGTVATGGVIGLGGQGTGGLATTGGVTGSGGRGSGGIGTGGVTGRGGSTGTGTCSHAQLQATDICTIGDSWIQMPGNQVTTLENHMATAGVILSGSHFDRREVSGSTLSSIVGTYTRKPSNCKILVMDGGGIDLFSTPLGPDSTAVTNVVNAFKQFLQKLASDGYVQHIVYSLYPVIPSTPNLNANMKPGFSAACAASTVHCVLVDLEPLFQGQHFASDRTHADTAGGVIIGDAWWKAMQQNCIAQ